MLAFRQPRNSGGPQGRPLRSSAVCNLAVADSCGVLRLLGEIISDMMELCPECRRGTRKGVRLAQPDIC